MSNKNDVIDARAIWLRVQQPSKAITVKTEVLRAILALHHMPPKLVTFRTAQLNALHGLLLEFGETVRKGRASLDKAVPMVLEHLNERLPPFLINLLEEQHRSSILVASFSNVDTFYHLWQRH